MADTPVTFGLQLPCFSFPSRKGENVWAVGREIAQTAEGLGFESVWLMDHLYQIPVVAPETDPLLECWTGLAALAASTRRVKLGSMVSAVTFRNPALLAKMTSTIDVVSGGRLIAGIGGAWCEWEHRGYGLDFPPTPVRLRMLEEAIQILKAMWTQERATFEGKYFHARGAVNSPKPVQKPHPPILIGGSGEKVTLRICAQYAQAHNLGGGTPEQCAKTLQTLLRHCDALGTDYCAIWKTRLTPVMLVESPRQVEAKVKRLCPPGTTPGHLRMRTLMGTPDQVGDQLQAFVDAGVESFIVSFWDVDDLSQLKTFAKEVMPRFARIQKTKSSAGRPAKRVASRQTRR